MNDREKLIAEAKHEAERRFPEGEWTSRTVILTYREVFEAGAAWAALAAVPSVDEDALAEVIPDPRRSSRVAEWPEDEQEFFRNGEWSDFTDREEKLIRLRRLKTARAVVEWMEKQR